MGVTGISFLILLKICVVLSSYEIRNGTSICKPKGNLLDLSYKRLNKIPSCEEELNISYSNMATKLDLGNNNISVIEYTIIKTFPNISTLYLPYNKIKSLNKSDEVIITKIKILDLGRNIIEHVEEGALNNFKQLQHLYLHHNRIKDLPEDIFLHLDHLTMIDLRNNKLPTLKYNWFSGLLRLQKLELSHNSIEKLDPQSFEWQPSLCKLNVSGNKLKMMPPLLKCERKSESCNVDFTQNPTYCWCRNVIYNNKCEIYSQCGEIKLNFFWAFNDYSKLPTCKPMTLNIFYNGSTERATVTCEALGNLPRGMEIIVGNERMKKNTFINKDSVITKTVEDISEGDSIFCNAWNSLEHKSQRAIFNFSVGTDTGKS